MFCPKCGVENKDGAAFCKDCGAKFNKPEGEQGIVAIADTEVAKPQPNNRNTRKPLAIGGAAAAAIVLIAAGFGVYKAFFEPYPINAETFPDQAFCSYVAENFDTDGNGELSRDEARAIEYIGKWDESSASYDEPISDKGIASLEGISCFPNLKGLVANDNVLTNVDLSKNKALEYVSINDKTLENLDVSGCSNLEDIWTSLDTNVIGAPSDLQESHLMTSGTAYIGSHYENSRNLSLLYSPDGRLIEYAEEHESDGQNEVAKNYEYDANGLLSKATRTDYEGGKYVTVYSRDEEGKLVAKKEHSDYAEAEDSFTYDEQGKVSAEVLKYKVDGRYSYQYDSAYEYDKEGRLSKVARRTNYNESESIYDDSLSVSYLRDDLIEKVERHAGQYDIDSVDAFSYDENGRLIKYVSSEKTSNWSDKTTYEYSDDGKEMTDSHGAVYAYDDEGRLLKKSYGDNIVLQCSRESLGFVAKQEETSGDTEAGFEFEYLKHFGSRVISVVPEDFDETKLGSNGASGSWVPKGEAYLDHYADYVAGAAKPGVAETYFYFGGPA